MVVHSRVKKYQDITMQSNGLFLIQFWYIFFHCDCLSHILLIVWNKKRKHNAIVSEMTVGTQWRRLRSLSERIVVKISMFKCFLKWNAIPDEMNEDWINFSSNNNVDSPDSQLWQTEIYLTKLPLLRFLCIFCFSVSSPKSYSRNLQHFTRKKNWFD